jgi:hypothetical protein
MKLAAKIINLKGHKSGSQHIEKIYGPGLFSSLQQTHINHFYLNEMKMRLFSISNQTNELKQWHIKLIFLVGYCFESLSLILVLTPGDIEGHLGRDGRFYVLDAAR